MADYADARRRAEEDLLHVIEWLESGHWMACQPLFADDGAKAREKGQRLRALLAAEKAREEADAYAGRANARIADLGERLDATEAVLRDAEKARKEAERERDEARRVRDETFDKLEDFTKALRRPR